MKALGKGFCRLIDSLPLAWQRALGTFLGFLWFDVFRIRRRVILENVQRAFPELSENERLRIGRRSCHHMGQVLVEYCRLPFLWRDSDKEKVEFLGWENIERALARGKGLLLLTLHIGHPDFGIAILRLRGLPLHVLSKDFKVGWLNRLWFSVRKRSGAIFVPARNSSFAVLKALRKGEAVAFVLDQFTGPPIGVRSRFFGHETGTGMGLAVMAQRTQAPVVPAFVVRSSDGRFRLLVEPEIPFPKIDDPQEAIEKATQVYNDYLETVVRRYPEQWMWVHKRWKPFRVE